jgi:hypothetical protein
MAKADKQEEDGAVIANQQTNHMPLHIVDSTRPHGPMHKHKPKKNTHTHNQNARATNPVVRVALRLDQALVGEQEGDGVAHVGQAHRQRHRALRRLLLLLIHRAFSDDEVPAVQLQRRLPHALDDEPQRAVQGRLDDGCREAAGREEPVLARGPVRHPAWVHVDLEEGRQGAIAAGPLLLLLLLLLLVAP